MAETERVAENAFIKNVLAGANNSSRKTKVRVKKLAQGQAMFNQVIKKQGNDRKMGEQIKTRSSKHESKGLVSHM